ncbi:MAG: corrinoid protein [Desulfobacterales bacterium]|nr:corrinoid protein [Desulfobacterales bacterium]
MFDLEQMINTLIEGDESNLITLVRAALDQGMDAKRILNDGLIAGMDIVGAKMENDELFIPEVLMAAKAMSAGVEILKPFLSADDMGNRGIVVIGTVKGDLHDIGKNLVAMMLESAGLEVHNLGADVSPNQFLEVIKEKKAGMLCLSALLTTTMPMMKETIDAVTKKGLRKTIKIMVGGAPVTQNFADEIGADGYAPDAGSAVKLAKELLQLGSQKI